MQSSLNKSRSEKWSERDECYSEVEQKGVGDDGGWGGGGGA